MASSLPSGGITVYSPASAPQIAGATDLDREVASIFSCADVLKGITGLISKHKVQPVLQALDRQELNYDNRANILEAYRWVAISHPQSEVIIACLNGCTRFKGTYIHNEIYIQIEQISKYIKTESNDSEQVAAKIVECFQKLEPSQEALEARGLHERPLSQHLYYLASVAGFGANVEMREASLKELTAVGHKYFARRSLTEFVPQELFDTVAVNLNYESDDGLQSKRYEFIKLVIDHLRSALKPEQTAADREKCAMIFRGVIAAVIIAATSGEKNKELMAQGIAEIMALELEFMRSLRENIPSTIIQILGRIESGFQVREDSESKAIRNSLCHWALDQVFNAFCQFPKDLTSLEYQVWFIEEKIRKIEQKCGENLQVQKGKLQAFKAQIPTIT